MDALQFVFDAFEAVRDFMTLGGDVLNVIALTIFAMWALIVERFIYYRTGLKKLGQEVMDTWEAPPGTSFLACPRHP